MILRDPVSSSTHWMASFCAIFVTLILWRLTRGDLTRRVTSVIFGLSAVCLYAASGLFHALNLPPEQLRVYQKLDQSCIYLLIAGSYTPIIAILLNGRFRTGLLLFIWIFALVGIACQWLFPKPPYTTTVGLYLGMGWIGFLGVFGYFRAVGWTGMKWAIASGAWYTFGAVCELYHWPVIWPGVIQWHEVLHVADMIGTFCHVIFIIRYVLPYRPVDNIDRKEPMLHVQAA